MFLFLLSQKTSELLIGEVIRLDFFSSCVLLSLTILVNIVYSVIAVRMLLPPKDRLQLFLGIKKGKERHRAESKA